MLRYLAYIYSGLAILQPWSSMFFLKQHLWLLLWFNIVMLCAIELFILKPNLMQDIDLLSCAVLKWTAVYVFPLGESKIILSLYIVVTLLYISIVFQN